MFLGETPLCYSMNVHPGEGLDDVIAAIEEYAAPLKQRIGGPGEFAVGLRLAARAAEEAVRRIDELKACLDRHGLRAVTVNAFPFGDFHGERVKEEVYRPDWSESRRAVYSLRAAVVLAALARPKAAVSISTLPLSYKAFRPSINAVTGRLLEMISMLQGVERKSGVRVRVGLEPEPFCLLETAAETVAYWKETLLPACRAKYGRGAEDLAHSYLGVCLDTCHHSVRWESPKDAIDLYRAAGIPIPKIQLSCALEAPDVASLRPFAEPRYLHQVVSQGGEARPDIDGPDMKGPVRCHFHVPIHKQEVAGLRTTQSEMLEAFRHARALNATDCYEIETYTWDVLPQKEGTLLASLAAEFRSLREPPSR